MWMKEIIRAAPGCFIGRRQPRIVEENIAELSLCFQGGREEGDILFERCENGGAGIFTPMVRGGITCSVFMSSV